MVCLSQGSSVMVSGTDNYVHHMMNKKVDEVEQGAKKCWEVLGEGNSPCGQC